MPAAGAPWKIAAALPITEAARITVIVLRSTVMEVAWRTCLLLAGFHSGWYSGKVRKSVVPRRLVDRPPSPLPARQGLAAPHGRCSFAQCPQCCRLHRLAT